MDKEWFIQMPIMPAGTIFNRDAEMFVVKLPNGDTHRMSITQTPAGQVVVRTIFPRKGKIGITIHKPIGK